jgi:WhiB family redox-sensing transcriptional regulator
VALSSSRNLSIAAENDHWRSDAACRDTDPDLFFPVGTTGPALEQIATAQRVCQACLVQSDCLEFALMTNQDSGIWGGTSEDDRRKLRKAWLAHQREMAS